MYNVWQLLYGLMLPSGNDASLALAVWGGRLLLAADANGKTFADTHVDFEGESIRDTSK